jgi:hypothetical protein
VSAAFRLRSISLKTSPRPRALPLSLAGGSWNHRPLPLIARAVLALEVLFAYVAVRFRSSRTELPVLVRDLRGRQDGDANRSGGEVALQRDLSARLGYVVQTLLRRAPAEGPCLVRALVLTKLLGRRQIPARLVIGVRSEPSFYAHAWVEHRGEAMLPTEAAFRRLVEL